MESGPPVRPTRSACSCRSPANRSITCTSICARASTSGLSIFRSSASARCRCSSTIRTGAISASPPRSSSTWPTRPENSAARRCRSAWIPPARGKARLRPVPARGRRPLRGGRAGGPQDAGKPSRRAQLDRRRCAELRRHRHLRRRRLRPAGRGGSLGLPQRLRLDEARRGAAGLQEQRGSAAEGDEGGGLIVDRAHKKRAALGRPFSFRGCVRRDLRAASSRAAGRSGGPPR
jgi:hypothetical protein